MRSYSLAWVPESDGSRLVHLVNGSPGIAFPHFVEDAGDAKSLSFAPSAKTLSLGILVATDDSARFVMAPLPTDEQFRRALTACCSDFNRPSVDDLCVNGAAYLRAYFGHAVAIQALRRAIDLFPDAPMCRDDLASTEAEAGVGGQKDV